MIVINVHDALRILGSNVDREHSDHNKWTIKHATSFYIMRNDYPSVVISCFR